MRKKFQEFIKRIDNPEMMAIVYIPGLIFILDFSLRASLDLDLVDAGADMALLAVTSAFYLLIQGQGVEKHIFSSKFILAFFFLCALVIWVITLRLVSVSPEGGKSPLILLFASWLFGITSFVISGLLVEMDKS